MKKKLITCVGLVLFALATANSALAQIEHVLIIGIDGLSSSGLRRAHTPTLDKLIQQGAIAWDARTVLPTVSSPNWTSIITGAGPEQHGVLNNDWEVNKPNLPAIVKDQSGRFPSLFTAVKQQKPGAKIASIYHWGAFGRLYDQSMLDFDRSFSTADQCVRAFSTYLNKEKPTLAFLHLDQVDAAGHKDGHGSPGYLNAIAELDTMITLLMEAITEAGMHDNSLIILVSDHGGKGKGHGGTSMEEVTVPILLYGAGIRPGTVIDQPTIVYDVAATAAWALKVSLPQAAIGRPIKQAFK